MRQYVGDDADLARRHPEGIGCGISPVYFNMRARDEALLVRGDQSTLV